MAKKRPKSPPPVVRFNTEQAAADQRTAARIPLFYIDDDEFTIPERIDGATTLRYLEAVRTRGAEAAIAELVREVIGADGWDALVSFQGMKADELRQLLEGVEFYALGQVEEATRGLGN